MIVDNYALLKIRCNPKFVSIKISKTLLTRFENTLP